MRFLYQLKCSFNLVILTFSLVIVNALRAMLDCNVLMLSFLTIKGTAVIKPERTDAWL